jgi:hypothetical protein
MATWLFAQEAPPNTGVVATGAYIEVSDSLYKSIKDWLLFGKEEQKLDDFLLSRYYNEREVLDFLGAYYSGAYGGNTNKTQIGQECVCNVIKPTLVDFHKSPGISDWNKINEEPNNHTEEYSIASDGMFKVINHKIRGTQGGSSSREINSFVKIELLQLCTYEGAPQTECNCNKPIFLEGAYYRYFDHDIGTSWCFLCNHGREGKWTDGFLTTSLDLVPSGNTTWIAPEITVSNGDVFERQFSHHGQWVNWNALMTVATEVAKMIVTDFNFSPNSITKVLDVTSPGVQQTQTVNIPPGSTQGITNLANALVNIPGHNSQQSPSPDQLHTTTFNSALMLKANTPKVLFFATSSKSELSAFGSGFNDIRITASSAFYVAYHIPDHPLSYNYDGEVIGQDWNCCNEVFGAWYYTPVWLKPGSQWQLDESVLKARIMSILNYGGYNYQFSYSSEFPKGSGINTAVIDDQQDHPIVDLVSYQGEVGSINVCGCENLVMQNANGQPNSTGTMLSPELVASALCVNSSSSATITDNKFPSNLVNQGLVTTEWYLGGIPLNQQNQPSITVNTAGRYSLQYQDANSLVCRTVSFIDISECPGKTEYSESEISILPNPAVNYVYIGGLNEEMFEIQIFDLYGNRVMFKTDLQGTAEVDISKLSQGIYSVVVKTNKTSYYEKVVVVK